MKHMIFNPSRKLIFLIIATAIVLTNIFGVNKLSAEISSFVEIAVLTDFVLVIPAIYIFCFRNELKQALVKAIAISCLGFWGAGFLIPESQQSIIKEFGTFRYIGASVLFLIEFKLVLLIWRSIFDGKEQKEVVSDVTESSDIPEWVARLIAWEASIWKRIVQKFNKSD